ncbi:MAG: hypothetical protein MZV65_32070 [Chromatiales bacterium]|nr:hypothetical protein [Chromatiales bacterium]
MKERMLFRLYSWPITLFLFSLIVYWILGSFIPSRLAMSPFLSQLVEKSADIAPIAFGIAISVTISMALYQSFRLWNWSRNKGDLCSECGGIVDLKNGRNGLYTHCLACGGYRKY